MKTLIIAVSLIAAHRAHASSCHGGGGGGGSSSGGGGGGGSYSSGSSSSSSSGSSSAPACSETTDVEGYRECHKFGEWAQSMVLPHMFVEMGGGVRRFSTWLPGRAGSVTHGDESFTYRVAMPAGGDDAESAVTWNGRVGIGFAHGLYVGLEGEMGALASTVAATPEMRTTGTFGTPTLSAARGIVAGIYGIAGARITSMRGAIAVEGAGGVRDVQYAFDSTYHDCAQTTTIGVSRGVVEARVRAEMRLGPWFTAGMTAGASLVDRGDFTTGVYVGMHTRSFR